MTTSEELQKMIDTEEATVKQLSDRITTTNQSPKGAKFCSYCLSACEVEEVTGRSSCHKANVISRQSAIETLTSQVKSAKSRARLFTARRDGGATPAKEPDHKVMPSSRIQEVSEATAAEQLKYYRNRQAAILRNKGSDLFCACCFQAAANVQGYSDCCQDLLLDRGAAYDDVTIMLDTIKEFLGKGPVGHVIRTKKEEVRAKHQPREKLSTKPGKGGQSGQQKKHTGSEIIVILKGETKKYPDAKSARKALRKAGTSVRNAAITTTGNQETWMVS